MKKRRSRLSIFNGQGQLDEAFRRRYAAAVFGMIEDALDGIKPPVEDKVFALAVHGLQYVVPRLQATEVKGTLRQEHRFVDAPPQETEEEWNVRRSRELALLGAPAGTAD